MKKLIISIALLAFLSGCGLPKHSATVETFNATGEPTGSYKVTLGRQMLMEVVASNGVTVKADSRGESTWGQFLSGLIEMVTLGLIVK